MRDLSEWSASRPFAGRPWLILGKGPTFSRLPEFDVSGYNLLSLNHVVSKVDVDVAHIVDLEVVEACAERLLAGCRYLVVPWRMHQASSPMSRTTEEIVDRWPVLAELDRAGRLVGYNLETSPPVRPGPMLTVKFFSVEPALQVAVALGATTVRTLGIDGGRAYSPAFNDTATLLVNGRDSFDGQFAELDAIAAEHGVDLAPLVPPLRVFIGVDDSQLVAARVLEHSIRSNTTHPVVVSHLRGPDLPRPSRPDLQGGTEFSFARFAIPALAGYRGRAVYLDADMQVFGDIVELADIPFDGATVLCTSQSEAPLFGDASGFTPGRQLSVMVLDCERLMWDAQEIVTALDEGRYSYSELMTDLVVVPADQVVASLPEGWNHLDRYAPGETRLVHYTNVPTQPWKNDEHPLAALWMSAYRDAVRAGAVLPDEVDILVARGDVKRSLTAALAQGPSRRSPLTSTVAAAKAIASSADLERRLTEAELELGAIKGSRAYQLSVRLARVADAVRQRVRHK